MLSLIAAVYLLLALRVRLQADASICGAGSSLSLAAGAAGVELRFDGVLRRGEDGFFLHITPRYGAPLHFSKPTKLHVRRLRIARPYMIAAVHAGRLEQITLRAEARTRERLQALLDQVAGVLPVAARDALKL